ncbi:efflux RND transporter permease subunit [Poseidonibacter ostreae]|uniref:MMPL family transporter n=1 Tax=Poseidonibacter ostreae TaxID=2654171 RepID=A0A6L4WVK2_9BACT|nr:efflux RND transporter permease subunit [Poseidonibacter ostreae]KAB7890627.1 MMPL family transporter [Poseidonibacter ostreae]KAB7892389.1 MMPL family transporter [Poseidonibacter ostreae]
MKNIVKAILSRPFFVYSFLALFLFLGINGYFKLDKKLFPNSNRPEIAIVIVQPSASAKDMASNIAIPLESELYTIDKVRRVYSSTIDEVSVIRVEFEYEKSLIDASSDVRNSIDKIKSSLPSDILEPQLHKISESTAPIITIAASSKNNLPLEDIRQIIENDIAKGFLKLKGIANVDIFGGYKKELQIIVSKEKLDKYGLSLAQVMEVVKQNNKDYALGSIDNQKSRFLLKIKEQKDAVYKIREIQINQDLKLKDIAKIYFGYYNNSAIYHGNSQKAIALSIQRNDNSDVVSSIEIVEKHLETVRKDYPNLSFNITDTQKTTIVQSTDNMFIALRDAIIMSMIVVFIFLASFRQIFVVLLTIPMVYVSTIALMWLFGLEFNIITLTAIILALGLLLDDTVVVVENIERHYSSIKEPMSKAVLNGTSEIMFADFSGTLTTIVALLPILFIGDYPQTVFGPLIGTLLLALIASFFVSITFVPLISTKILAIDNKYILLLENKFNILSDIINNFFVEFFINTVKLALEKKVVASIYLLALMALFFISAKIVMPMAGQELMPAMDTGAAKIKIVTDSNMSIQKTEEILDKAESIINKNEHIQSISSSIGGEAGVLSIGSGGGVNDILIIANYVNRFNRSETIWEIEAILRNELSKISDIKRLEVSDAGATAMASIKANIDVTLYGNDLNKLYEKALEYEKAMYNTQGIVNVSKTWNIDNSSYILNIDAKKAFAYGIKEQEIVTQLQLALRGSKVAFYPIVNSVDLPLRVWLEKESIQDVRAIQTLLIDTPKGKIPLNTIASISTELEPNIITREGLDYTIDILGFREKASISHLMANFEEAASHIELPNDIKLVQTGDIQQLQDSSIRIIKAVGLGLLLIFLIMIPMFNSLKIPILIILSIPLTIGGASWILILLDYHSSMSAMIGFILLAGVIVNNAILLIHFAIEKQNEGWDAKEAIMESIKTRTRPVLMTAISVSVGMIPVALGWAIGMERLAPLGAVVIGGLIVGTFLTLVFIPLFFVWIHKQKINS